MEVIKTIKNMRNFVKKHRIADAMLGFVPTMGALHAGHESLITESVKENDITVVSIFINSTQFDKADDLKHYPKTKDADLEICRSLGVDAVFMPSEKEIYGTGSMIMISVAHLADRLCGISRPGHFRGVMLIVAKLFNIVQPDRAYFGEKDIQQLVIVRTMVHNLNYPIEIRPVPLVRDFDGLALSSRNARLTPEQRASALALSKTLFNIQQKIRDMEGTPEYKDIPISDIIAEFAEDLVSDPNIELDYFSAVDTVTFDDVTRLRKNIIFALAVYIGDIRLIDNWIYR